MKTEELIEKLRCCYKGKCDKCTMKMKSGCINELLFESAKKIADLKKDLADREAAPGWISVEERMPEESGYYLAYDCRGNLFICLYQANGLWDSSSVDYWMPLPEPPKKVKTYKDVYRERIKEVFPDFTNKDPKPSYCRSAMFGEDFNREYICGKMKDCEDCWNQPYPEEEGGEE